MINTLLSSLMTVSEVRMLMIKIPPRNPSTELVFFDFIVP